MLIVARDVPLPPGMRDELLLACCCDESGLELPVRPRPLLLAARDGPLLPPGMRELLLLMACSCDELERVESLGPPARGEEGRVAETAARLLLLLLLLLGDGDATSVPSWVIVMEKQRAFSNATLTVVAAKVGGK